MKFKIDDTVIDLTAVGDLTQHESLLMAKAGMGLQTWVRTMDQISRLARAEDGETVVVLSVDEAKARRDEVDPDLFFDSPRHLLAMIIACWIGRRHAGSPSLSFEESARVPWSKFSLVPDDEDEDDADEDEQLEEAPDPTQPPGSGPVDGSAAAPSSES